MKLLRQILLSTDQKPSKGFSEAQKKMERVRKGRSSIFLFITAIIAVMALGNVLAFPVSAESNPMVLMYDVQGNTHVPSEKVLGVISNSRIGEPLDPKMVQLDMEAIHNLGYFADVRATTEKLFDGVKLVFTVVENPLFKEVRISGLTKIKPEELKPLFTQKPGDVFNTATFSDDLGKAMKFCQEKKGYFVRVNGNDSLSISPDGVVNLKLTELKYGKTKVLGLLKTKEKVVLRELPFKEGDLINLNDLQSAMISLMRLRLFDNIEPKFELSDSTDALDLVLELKEAQTGTFSFGASYSDKSHEIGGVLGYSESNLMGLGQNLSLDLNISQSSKNIQMSFNEPWLDDYHTSFGLSMWNSDNTTGSTMRTWLGATDPTAYDMHFIRTGISLNLGRPLWKDTSASLGFSFEKNNIDHYYFPGTTNPGPLPTTGVPLEFWDNSVQLSLTNNKLRYADSNFVNGGHLLQGTVGLSGKYLGGYFDYQKYTFDWKGFHAFTPNLVLGSRAELSKINGSYPDYDQLYLGGMYKLRGYTDRRYDGDNSALIGDAYWLSNTELRYRLPSNKNLEFVAFYDIGQVYDNGTGKSLKSDYGIGFRVIVPLLGCIRLDQAWNSDNESRLVFSLNELF